MKQKNWLIIADGEPLSKAKTQRLAKNKSVIALDGALKVCLDYEILPDLVMGDFDALSEDFIKEVKTKYNIPFERTPCQNSTDLEKALHYLYDHHAKNICICHATGRRLDHTLYNLRLLKRFHNKFTSLEIITEIEKIYFIKDTEIILQGEKDDPVAILGFPEAKITSRGLTYDMQTYELKLGHNESTSNKLKNDSATLQVFGDALLLISHNISLT